MTNTLADELQRLISDTRTSIDAFSALNKIEVFMLDNLPTILAALREREAMRAALEKIARMTRTSATDEVDAWELRHIARAALSGGGDA